MVFISGFIGSYLGVICLGAPIPGGLEGSGPYLQPRGSRTVPTADDICRCGSRVCNPLLLSGKFPGGTRRFPRFFRVTG
jgi:hypothetical protein